MVKAIIGEERYTTTVKIGDHQLMADEPKSLGGLDAGPDPVKLLMASLAGCIAITLKMYIDRKEWDISQVTVEVRIRRSVEKTDFYRHIAVEGDADEKTMKRLYQIASKCPVSKMLKGDVQMHNGLPEE